MNKERRVFDTTFKLEVVKLIKEQPSRYPTPYAKKQLAITL